MLKIKEINYFELYKVKIQLIKEKIFQIDQRFLLDKKFLLKNFNGEVKINLDKFKSGNYLINVMIK